jgi:hypothetical protein
MEPTGSNGIAPQSALKTAGSATASSEFALLLIGEPGTRKSTIQIHFPKVLVFDCDRKIANMKNWYPKADYGYVQPDLYTDGSFVPKEERWQRLTELVKAYGKGPEYKVNGMDSLTRISDYLIDFLMANEPDSKKPVRGGIRTMSEGLWYPYKERLSGFISAIRSLGRPCIFTVHCRDVFNDAGSLIGQRPSVSGQMAALLPGYFTDVWHTYTRQVANDAAHPDGIAYMVRTVPTPMLPSLVRSYGVPAEFEFSWETLRKHYPHLASL